MRTFSDILKIIGSVFLMILIGFGSIVGLLVISAAILKIFWNMSIPYIFGFSTLTMWNSLMLMCSINALREPYLASAVKQFKIIKKALYEKDVTNESVNNTISVIATILLIALSITLSVVIVGYTWNSILPQIFNADIVKITWQQSLALIIVCGYIIGRKNTNNTEDKK